ncbi:MAG: hypothetical protein IKK39_12210, partial [Thermoguttaceae bacterium]|nr:hypothetical protein [Thermoguttaceae bacterium]
VKTGDNRNPGAETLPREPRRFNRRRGFSDPRTLSPGAFAARSIFAGAGSGASTTIKNRAAAR